MTTSEDLTNRRWTFWRVAAVLLVVAFVGFWVWAFSPLAPDDNPDRLQDREFAEAAESRCAAMLDRIAGIPSARDADSRMERSEQVRAGTIEVEVLVAELRELSGQVKIQAEQDILVSWFEDWDQYIADRWAHVTRLAEADDSTPDRDLAFVISAILDSGIYTERLDGFARVNDMDSCLIPGDV